MITNEQAAKMFEGETIEAIPTDMKRIIIPTYGFAGGKDTKRQEWGADGPFMEDVKGLDFYNPKDNATQVLKAKDGVLICYDAPGRKEKIDTYLKEHPLAVKTADQLTQFIDYLSKHVVNEGGKADLWDSDVNFAAGLVGAPAKEDIKPGKTFTGAKKKEVVQVIRVPEGTEFEGPEALDIRENKDRELPKAGKDGAFLIKDSAGIRMIQKEEFAKAYLITKVPNTLSKQRDITD